MAGNTISARMNARPCAVFSSVPFTASFQRRVNLIARDIFHPDDATVKLYHDFCTPGLLLHAADKKVALF